MHLAEKYNMLPEIGHLLDKYASTLMDKGTRLDVVQLYRKAGRYVDAAKIMFELAEEELYKRSKPLKMKKLFVLAALLIEEHNRHRKLSIESAGMRNKSMFENFENDTDADVKLKMIDTAWHGAEAFHFLMLAHRQLYEGHAEAAMHTALCLKNYENILNAEDIYSIIALASSGCQAFGTCSRAFMKLESLESISQAKQQEYADLAMEIFTKHATRDPRLNHIECSSCSTIIPIWSGVCHSCGTRYPSCIVSGRLITNLASAWSCPTCHHSALYNKINLRDNCPLCHAVVK